MTFHQLYPWRCRLPSQLLQSGQFDTRHVLEHDQHGFFINFSRCDLGVAMGAILQSQIVGGNGYPEFQITHGLKPGFNFIDVFENFHGPILSNQRSRLQILARK